ncbi:MAG: toprim domain-containing protein [Cyclobacteriaceae bacterium]
MNIKQAKERFALWGLLALLGFEPDQKKSKGNDLWYKSPFRPGEEIPSFHIDKQFNIWKDFGLGEKGGDLIAFVRKYLEYNGKASSASDALQWLRELDGSAQITVPQYRHSDLQPVLRQSREPAYKILANTPLKSPVLFEYLKKRRINFPCAKRHLRQLYFMHNKTKKKIFGFGFRNRSGDYDFGNPLGFKSCLGKKDISYIAGTAANDTVEVFEGFMDYLTRLTIQGHTELENDVVVLNSTSMVHDLVDLIADYKYKHVLLWLDNDPSGKKADGFARENLITPKISLTSMNPVYKGYKDLNQWHMDSTLGIDAKKLLIHNSLNNQSTDELSPCLPR